jgi:outer membrane protein OmpA-like peptidoglycan-associated protein
MRIVRLLVGFGFVVVMGLGCSAWDSLGKTEKGAVIGAGAGGVLGGIIGAQSGNTVVGVLLGAAIGGVAGGAIGGYMDKQSSEIQANLPGADVERVGEGLRITYPSDSLFFPGTAELRPEADARVANLSTTLVNYSETNLAIAAYTDSAGDTRRQMNLTEEQARALGNALERRGVAASRIATGGYGATGSTSREGTEEGRAPNRRVEIAIFANETLKDRARSGQLAQR